MLVVLCLVQAMVSAFAAAPDAPADNCLSLVDGLQICVAEQASRIRVFDARQTLLAERTLRTLDEHPAHLRGWLQLPQRQSVLLAIREQAALYELSYADSDVRIYRGYVHDFRMGEGIAEPLRFTPRAVPLEHHVLHWMELAPDRVLLINDAGEIALLNLHVRRLTSRIPLAPAVLGALNRDQGLAPMSQRLRVDVGPTTCVRILDSNRGELLQLRISADGQQLTSGPCAPTTDTRSPAHTGRH